MNSIKQTFGILIVALALFGAYTLVFPKKPVNDGISEDFRNELAQEGIYIDEDAGKDGKSALFGSLAGVPGVSSATNSTGKSGSVPSLLGGAPKSTSPAPPYANQPQSDSKLDDAPEFDDAPAWNGGGDSAVPPAGLNAPNFDVPLLDIPTLDEPKTSPSPTPANALPAFDDAPLFDPQPIDPPQAEPFETTLLDRSALNPPEMLSDDAFALNTTESTSPPPQTTPAETKPQESLAFEPFDSAIPTAKAPETLDDSAAFSTVDLSTAMLQTPLGIADPNAKKIEPLDSTISYNQRAPVNASLTPDLAPPSEGGVRPLPPVEEEPKMALVSGLVPANQAAPTTISPPAPSGDFGVSNELDPISVPDEAALFDLTAAPGAEIAMNAPATSEPAPPSAPGIARSTRRQTTPQDALPPTQSIDPRVIPNEVVVGPTGQLEPIVPPSTTATPAPSTPVERNPISQNSVRPDVSRKITKIKSILNDENAEYRDGHQLITELYLSDLNFAERELVLPIADKCGWAAFFSSLSFDPYEWGRTIQSTDTLQTLAAENGISPELILKINRLENPNQLTPGRENVKIPKGPFDATIFLARKELVITANGLFACRFRIGVGQQEQLPEAVYQIEMDEKYQRPRYLLEDGSVIDSDDPRNPLGSHWIGLDREIGIHGTNNPSCIGTDNAPVIGYSMDNRDIAELFDILTSESRIIVRR